MKNFTHGVLSLMLISIKYNKNAIKDNKETIASTHMKQRAILFPNTPVYTIDAYRVGTCNEHAYNWIESYSTHSKTIKNSNITSPFHSTTALITGDHHSGKTHLCHIFLKKNPNTIYLNGRTCSNKHPFDLNDACYIVDDADMAPQPWLFHFFNHALAHKIHFILTSTHFIQDWCTLPDLSSRLLTLQHLHLELPDDIVVRALLQKSLIDKGLFVQDGTLDYLCTHIDRSYAKINYWVNKFERLSAEQRRNITISFVRSIMTDAYSS